MSETKFVRYVGPHRHREDDPESTAVEIVDTRYPGRWWGCRYGEMVEVPADVAGAAPSGTPGEEGYDPGSGVLAQVDNWELVSQRKGREATKAADAADESGAAPQEG